MEGKSYISKSLRFQFTPDFYGFLEGKNSKTESKRDPSPEDPGSSSVVKKPPSRVTFTIKVHQIQLSLQLGRSCLMQRQ